MYVRITTVHVPPKRVDDVIDRVQSIIVPFAQQQQGYHNFFLLVDQHSGKCLLMSLWETAVQRQVTDSTTAYLQMQIATLADLLTMTPVVEDYDALLPATG